MKLKNNWKSIQLRKSKKLLIRFQKIRHTKSVKICKYIKVKYIQVIKKILKIRNIYKNSKYFNNFENLKQ